MAKSLNLNTIFSWRQKSMLGGVFLEKDVVHMDLGKQMFGKQMFAGLRSDSGIEGTLKSRPYWVSPSHLAHILCRLL